MRYKYLLLLPLLIKCILLSAQTSPKVWLLKDEIIGKGILYKPKDSIDDELNNFLILTHKEYKEIVSPQNCTVKQVSYVYYESLSYINANPYNQKDYERYRDSLSIIEFDKEYRDTYAKYLVKDARYVSLSITMQNDNKEVLTIAGLRPVEYFKTGEKIKKGQILGFMGFSYSKIKKPSIIFEYSINGKSANPMIFFGLKSTAISLNNRIDYIKYKHSISKLKEDFTIFRKSLEEGHPGLYDYTSKSEMDKLFDNTYSKYNKPLTSNEFIISLLPVLKTIRDSHTALISQNKITDDSKPQVLFGIKEGNLIVYATLPEYKQYLNKRIIKINGEDVSIISSKVKKIIYGNDGYIETYLKRRLLEDFWEYYKKIKSLNRQDNIIIEFADNTSQSFIFGFFDKNTFIPKAKKEIKNRFLVYNYSKNIGIVDVNTFWLLETDLDSIGSFISNPTLTHLIIDVRDNLGGDINVIESLYSYIAKKPFKTSKFEMVNNNGKYDFFKYTFNYSDESVPFYNYIEKEGKIGFYLPKDEIYTINPDQTYHFDKQVYVLTNSYSKSAATIFPALVYKNKRGKIVGRETGSSYYQLNATKFAQVNLINTELELYMPLVKSVFDTKGNSNIPWGRGVIPDYNVKLDFNSFLGDKDPIMETTLQLMDNKNELKSDKHIYLLIGVLVFLFFITVFYKTWRNVK